MYLPCGLVEILGARQRVGRHGDGMSFLGGDDSVFLSRLPLFP